MQHYSESLALQLRHFRLEEGWSYYELAAHIGGLNASTLPRFIERPGEHTPLETTLYIRSSAFSTGGGPRPGGAGRAGPLEALE
jgi:hypothetical protein